MKKQLFKNNISKKVPETKQVLDFAKEKEEVLFPNLSVYKTDFFEYHQDWDTPIPGFIIVAPTKKGYTSIDQFSEEELTDFVLGVKKVRTAMREVGIEYVYFFQREDTDNGGYHLRLFPRRKRMESFGQKAESIRPIIGYAREKMNTKEHIEEVFVVGNKLKSLLN